ncbi:MAG: Cof-type HAD-IIB family hydrolase [Turicibacter sp.]|nr:Cof-type HAD-IIB family hydrolase [Turicibacter sp.]
MDLKVIALDVDGTLFSSQKGMLPKTKAALIKAQDMGIKIILASGRPTSGLTEIAKELNMDQHNGLLVSYNGSKIIDCETGETLFNEPLSIEDGKAVLEHMKKFNVKPMIDKDQHMYVNNVYDQFIKFQGKDFNVIEYEARGGNYLLCEQADLAAFLDYEVNKILTAADPEYVDEHHEAMAAPFKDTLNCVQTSPFFYEFTALGIDKAKALDTVLRPMGYTPENMIAFGDGMNDLTMLQYAGTGVAMDNAVDEVKANSQYVTASNDEEGIALALYKYIPELKV